METLIGTVLDGELLERVELHVGDHKRMRTTGSRLRLRLDDGREVTVSIDPEIVPSDDEETVKGQWSELAGHPWAAQFADAAPGGHVDVKLVGYRFAAGDRVAVFHFGDIAVRVSRAKRRRPASTRPRAPLERTILAMIALGIGLAVAGALTRPALILVGIFAIMFGLAMTLARPVLDGCGADTRERDEQAARGSLAITPPWHTGIAVFAGCGFCLVFVAVPAITISSKEMHGLTIATGVLAAATGAIGVLWTWVNTRSWIRVARIVLANGTAGVVISGTITRSVAFVERLGTKSKYTAAQPRMTMPASMRVRIGDAEAELALDQANWCAPVAYDLGPPTTLRSQIVEGDHVLIAGTPQGGTYRATGPESLIVFGAPGEPRAVLRRIVRGYYLLLGSILALSALAVVLSL